MHQPEDLPDRVTEALRGVVDPELGDDIVSLGMVRAVTATATGEVMAEIALTIASCPLRTQLKDDVERAVRTVPGVTGVEVRTGVMTQPERSELMSRARLRAQERSDVATDLPATTRVLAIASGKGGVGKSSVTVNLAVAIASRGHAVGILGRRRVGPLRPAPARDGRGHQRPQQEDGPAQRQLLGAGGVVRVISMGFLADEDDGHHVAWVGAQPSCPALP